jgi:hypothetical protein
MVGMQQFACFIDALLQVLDEMEQAHSKKKPKGKIVYGRCIVDDRGAKWVDVAPLEKSRGGG